MHEATDYENRLSLQDNEESIAKVKASGKTNVYALTAEEQAAWRLALLPVHRQMEERIGKSLIEAVYREAAALGYKVGP